MFTQSARFRRVATGALLVLAPLLLMLAVIVDPGTWGDDREAVSYGDNPALAQLESVLFHWSWLLTAVAVIGVLHVVRRRAVVLGHVAGVVSVLGAINMSALMLVDPVEWWFGRHYPVAEAERLTNEVLGLPGVIFGYQMPWLFFALFGVPLVTVAVWRAGFVRWWVPALAAVGYIGALPVPYGPATVVLWTLPLVALGSIGLRILRMSDADWISYYPSAALPTTAEATAEAAASETAA
ncbi:hypothetical protein GCM10009530_53020 [Microbispora corallina]|uniref:DUF4386 family protein n=1 Tax=Microbispora corallina TaxID=83302 RepID=A0ABQ4G343_9ACTN|nr:hypothetical protein [Microbispora corallina]GIH41477.1 hypothetical protein Mco01_44770 [Microbispora corallina]